MAVKEAVKTGAAIAVVAGVITAGYLGGMAPIDRLSTTASWNESSRTAIESAISEMRDEPKNGAQWLIEIAATAKEKGHWIDSNRLKRGAVSLICDRANNLKRNAFCSEAYTRIYVPFRSRREYVSISQALRDDNPAVFDDTTGDYITAVKDFEAVAKAWNDAEKIDKLAGASRSSFSNEIKDAQRLIDDIIARGVLRGKIGQDQVKSLRQSL